MVDLPGRAPGRRWIVALAALFLAWLVVRGATWVYVDALWYASEGFGAVFWKRTLWRWGLRALAGALVAVAVWANLRAVATTLGAIRIRRRFGNIEIAERLPRAYLNAGVLLASALMGLWFSAAITPDVPERVLLFLNSEPWGTVDPVFGRDISYYVFLLPLLAGALATLLVLNFVVLGMSVAGYAATGALRWTREGLELGDRPRVHLTALVAIFLALVGLRFLLGRHLLLLDGNSAVAGIYSGSSIFGLADHHARIPAFQGLAVVAFGAAGAVLWGGLRNRAVPVLVGIAVVIVGGIGFGEIYPAAIQRFRVEPNELAREGPYIEWNLDATRDGFGLSTLDRRPFEYDDATSPDAATVLAQMDGLPVWNREAFLATVRSLEARYVYYDFPRFQIGRYETEDGRIPVALSVREIEPAMISDDSWQNIHLRERYLAGEGAVAADASARTPEGRPQMLLSGIPTQRTGRGEGVPGIDIERPGVFVASSRQEYAVITPGDSTFRAPGGGIGTAGVDFPLGIGIDSGLRKLALAWRFGDLNLLVSSELGPTSRFVYRRQAQERVAALAPLVRLLEEPYPVIADGRVVWMIEGFTLSGGYPLGSAFDAALGATRMRYIRNAVKATVDAVTGEVRLYVSDPTDPIIQSYSRAYPSLFRPLQEMPPSHRAHIRYPRTLLEVQAQVLTRYHVQSAEVFYGRQDVWSIAQEYSREDQLIRYEPSYGLYRLPGDAEEGFHLTTVFVPEGRPNLTAILAARSDPERYGDLLLLDVAVEDQVPGPNQVEVLIEQDPEISPQFTLWRQGGSEVWLGHLHLIPVGSRILYMEPVFLAASDDAIPELRRFVVSDGRQVAMRDGLADAVAALWGGEGIGDPGEGEPGAEGALEAVLGTAAAQDALDLLEDAEERLRAGDWAGYGEALERLRALLERLAGG